MTTMQVTLSDSQSQAIETFGQREGKTSEEILREAVEQFLTQQTEKRLETRLEALRQARGLWRERDNLPDLEILRREWDKR